MDHAAILAAYIGQMTSRNLHLMAEKLAKVEYARMHLGEKALATAQAEADEYVRTLVNSFSGGSINAVDVVIEQESRELA